MSYNVGKLFVKEIVVLARICVIIALKKKRSVYEEAWKGNNARKRE
jgi:hypothetical protein